jgi:hypothetical protein
MTVKQYKLSLEDAINAHGYWSNQVLELNNKAMFTFTLKTYHKAHDEVLSKFMHIR